MDESLARLRREAELAPDDPAPAIRLAAALARASDADAAARVYMRLHAIAPELAIDSLAALLAGEQLKADDAAWLFAIFGGDPSRVLERTRSLARAFARRAPSERAQRVIAEIARFPDVHAASVLAACGGEEALREAAIASLRHHPAVTGWRLHRGELRRAVIALLGGTE